MRKTTLATLAMLAATAATANAQPVPRGTFELVNAGRDSVVALAIADAGDAAFHAISMQAPLRGGVSSLTLDLPQGDCSRDMRVSLQDGRQLLYRAIDVCRNERLRLQARDTARR